MRVVHRSMVLAALMEGSRSVGVTGTNGKGTVSSMITFLLHRAGLDPSFAIGAILLDFGTNARTGRGRHMVCELDESDGSFTNTDPDVLVINNLEADHLNFYKDIDGILDTFTRYLSGRPGTRVHARGDDPNVRTVLERSGALDRAVTFGTTGDCAYRILHFEPEGLGSRFTVAGPGGRHLGTFRLAVPGRYNAQNAVAALSVAVEEGVDVETAREAMPLFSGMENRFTVVRAGPCTVIKDYISHPTGIRNVLEAVRHLDPKRVVAVFKPYRFTMIHYLQDEYTAAFRDADEVLVTKMYTAGEVPIPGVDTAFLVKKIRSGGAAVRFEPDMERIPDVLYDAVRPGDAVVFFGGDDLFRVADTFAAGMAGKADR